MDERLFFPATLRNRAVIGEVLDEFLPKQGITLEIASGSGEHGVTFQKRLPNIIWQTSDSDQSCRRSINSWIRHERLTEKMPLAIDLIQQLLIEYHLYETESISNKGEIN